MTPAARVAAAIEVLDLVTSRREPVAETMKEWGRAHRFAGSGDRSAMASLVFDALRKKASSAWLMGADTPRAIMIGALRRARGLDEDSISKLFSGEGHAPAPLDAEERARLADGSLDKAPDHVRGDFPEWLAPPFAAAFGDNAVAEGAALSERAPVDLRVNTLRGSREAMVKELSHLGIVETPLSPMGLRIVIAADGRAPALAAEPAYVKGRVEVQDEGSQLASLLAGARENMQVLDLCAGGGGKSLALAAIMNNKGQIFATDTDGRRLAPIFQRIERAGARNIQVRAPRGKSDILGDLENRCDIVFVDAPCTGVGAWRRNPDAKWRTRPGALEQRMKDQDEALASAARFVKPGGSICYTTCSLLREEDEERIAAFIAAHADYLPRDAAHMARLAGVEKLAGFASRFGPGLRLSPLTSGTDGFYVASLVRAG